MKNYKLYILMRNDLPSLNAGKAMAQAAHAANHFVHKYGKYSSVKSWLKEGCGFGTTIVLAATHLDIVSAMKSCKNFSGIIYDTTYPYIVSTEIARLIDTNFETAPPIIKEDGSMVLFRCELTCAYIFMSDEDNLTNKYITKLPLYP